MAVYHRLMELSRDCDTSLYDGAMDRDGRGFGEWLRIQLDRRDWTQSDLARRLGMKSGVISSWINGVRRPSHDSCFAIARELGVDPELVVAKAGRRTLQQERNRPESFDDIFRRLEAQRPIAVPIVEQVASAGRGAGVIEGYVYLPPVEGRRPELFAMPVKGNCMDPEISPGDTIIVNKELPPTPGRLVVAVVDGGDVLVKRLMRRGNDCFLEARDGTSFRVDDRVHIVGVVIQINKRA